MKERSVTGIGATITISVILINIAFNRYITLDWYKFHASARPTIINCGDDCLRINCSAHSTEVAPTLRSFATPYFISFIDWLYFTLNFFQCYPKMLFVDSGNKKVGKPNVDTRLRILFLKIYFGIWSFVSSTLNK